MKPLTHSAFKPFMLSSQPLRNRWVVAPMTRNSASETGVPTHEMEDYYEAFAKGGFNLIITEGNYTDSIASQTNPNQPGIVTPKQLEGWKRVVQRVKAHGAVFICQLMHGGALSQHLSHTLAPSAIQPLGQKMPEAGGGDGPFPFPQEMTLADIRMAKEGFIQSALSAQEAGFDGVELHAANGYLLDQFVTEYTNQRTDPYGGTVENRFRIISELIAEIKAVVREDFILGLRLSEGKVNHLSYRLPGESETASAILAEVAKTPVSYVHIAAEGGNWARECLYANGQSYNSLASQITKRPVIANGGLHDLALSERLLQENHADLLAIGQAALADPDWPVKIENGQIPRPFSVQMIKPSLTLEHTRKVVEHMPEPLSLLASS